MIVNEERLIRDPFAPGAVWNLYAKEDNKPIFRGEAEVWPFVLDLPQPCYFGDFGRIEPGTMAQIVRVYESGTFFASGDMTDYRRDLSPLIVIPNGPRRILRMAWASSERIAKEPIPMDRATGNENEKRYTRLAPPGAPFQPFAFSRRFADHPCNAVRFLIATWETPPIAWEG